MKNVKKYYVDAVRRKGSGYTVFIHSGSHKHKLLNCHGNIVECMFGSDLHYLEEASVDGTELFRPLSESELKDLKDHKA